MNEQKIPKLIHFVWVTNPKKPRELVARSEQVSMVEDTMNNMRNYSGWKYHIWTNDKSVLPETVKWANAKGIIVREVTELGFYPEYESIFLQMVDENVVMATDLARFLIVYELGGMYLDTDQVIYEYDERLNSFDYFSYTTHEFSFDLLIAETSFFAGVPLSPIIEEYLK